MTSRALSVVVGVAALTATAHAQSVPSDIAISTFNPSDATAPQSTVEGPGIKVGEGTVLHPVFGLETGVVSNVFFTNTNEQASGLLRVMAQLTTASLSTARLNPAGAGDDPDDPQANLGNFQYRAAVRAAYDQYLSSDGTVRGVSGLGLGASLHGMANAQGTFSLGVDEDFNRLIRSANFETTANTNRDINTARLLVQYHPHDRAIGGFLYYQNYIDIFERSQQNFADRIRHTLGLHPMWRLLPQTTLYADISWAYNSALDASSMKVTSYPLTAKAGIATLLSLKTTFNVEAGYTNGFYERGPSFSGPVIGANVGYRYSPLGRISAGYAWIYDDSINANFYRDHVLYATLLQVVSPIVLMVQPELHIREYDGVTLAVPGLMGPDTRNDTILSVIAGAHYTFRNWIAATLDYRFSTVQTDYRYNPTGGGTVTDPSYTRHELLAGLRIAM